MAGPYLRQTREKGHGQTTTRKQTWPTSVQRGEREKTDANPILAVPVTTPEAPSYFPFLSLVF